MARVLRLQMFFLFFKTAVLLQGDGPDELDPREHLRHPLLHLQGPQLKLFPFDEFDHYTNAHYDKNEETKMNRITASTSLGGDLNKDIPFTFPNRSNV